MARSDHKDLPDQKDRKDHKVYQELTVQMEQSDLKGLKVYKGKKEIRVM